MVYTLKREAKQEKARPALLSNRVPSTTKKSEMFPILSSSLCLEKKEKEHFNINKYNTSLSHGRSRAVSCALEF